MFFKPVCRGNTRYFGSIVIYSSEIVFATLGFLVAWILLLKDTHHVFHAQLLFWTVTVNRHIILWLPKSLNFNYSRMIARGINRLVINRIPSPLLKEVSESCFLSEMFGSLIWGTWLITGAIQIFTSQGVYGVVSTLLALTIEIDGTLLFFEFLVAAVVVFHFTFVLFIQLIVGRRLEIRVWRNVVHYCRELLLFDGV